MERVEFITVGDYRINVRTIAYVRFEPNYAEIYLTVGHRVEIEGDEAIQNLRVQIDQLGIQQGG